MQRASTVTALLAACAALAHAHTVLVEAESFADRGGWKIDQQFIEIMGSPYLLAHGLGEPVEDATTTVSFPAPGSYRVFVRTKDWVAHWGAEGSPGRFQLLVDGEPLGEVFGTKGAEWFWHPGGTVQIRGKEVPIALHDLTGFEGRCDAIVFTTEPDFVPPNGLDELAAFRKEALGLPEKPEEAGHYDLVVIGGGVAGTCAAVSAARLDLKVALIQNRPVLGGNSSSEVRVWIQGKTMLPPFPRLGEIVRELNAVRPKASPDIKERHGDEVKLEVVRGEPNIELFLNHHAYKVEMEGDRVQAVWALHTVSSRRVRFTGRLFADCTGDGTIGYLAGADYEMLTSGHMGFSNMWRVVDTGEPQPFPSCPWALDLRDKPIPTKLGQLGKWFWESGFDKDPIQEAEHIRDHNFRAMYGTWDALKNHKKLYPNHKLQWAAYIAGKRESRRLLGDVVLTQEHVVEGKEFPDACVPCTWSIDLHVPRPSISKYFKGEEFLSVAKYTRFKGPYPLPYRCLYSRNVANLFMAGRDISVTHQALGTVRVMGTGGMMGEVVGRAAAVCTRHDTTPRGVYQEHLEELKELLRTPLGKAPAPPPARKPKPPPPFKAPGENLALQAAVTVSGNYDPEKYPKKHINDGSFDVADNGQRWLSHDQTPNWVELAWDQPRTLAMARIISGYTTGGSVRDPIADFVLQVPDDGGWKDIPGTQVGGNTDPYRVLKFKPVTTRRLRLYVTEAQLGIARIWEIALYGPAED
ncbi:MAG: FAD-dependent oxidoreductase [Candidatus Brocadiia bacterium]